MDELRKQRAAALKAAQDIIDSAKGRDLTDDEQKSVDEKIVEVKGIDEKIEQRRKDQESRDLLKSLQDNGGDAPDDEPDDSQRPARREKSFGEAFTSGESYRSYRKNYPTGASDETPVTISRTHVGGMKALFKAPITSGLDNAQPTRLPTIDYTEREHTDLLDLVTRGSMTGSMIEYLQIVSVTEGAAIVAESTGGTGTTAADGYKPVSTLETTLANALAYTYADGFDITKQALADDGFTASYIQARLPVHLRKEVERVLLLGAGTGGEPAGILNTTGVQEQAFEDNMLDTIAAALEKVELADGETTGIALSVQDAWRLMKLRDDMGRYYSQGPWSTGPGTVWGVPIVKVRRLTPGQSIIGDFRTVALLDREGVSVEAFPQHADYARRNMVYVRAELRAAQAIFEPAKLVVTELAAADPGDG